MIVSLPADLRDRLLSLAGRTNRSLQQCVEHAVFEFVESWETHLRDVQALVEETDDRPFLRVVNE